MADISKITLPDSSEYNIKDATARSIANGKSTVSVSQTLTSGTEIGSVTVDGTATKLYAPQVGTQNIWYGTCPTGATAQTKVVTTSSGDFSLETGSMVRVKFTNAQTYNGGIKLNVDGTSAHNVMRQGTTATVRYFFQAGEVVDFVYDGTNYIAVNESIATTTYYGVTKLSSATNSTSAVMAATPAAVKAAYDHADSKSKVSISQTQTSGTEIATITIDNVTTSLYTPTSSDILTDSYDATTKTVTLSIVNGDVINNASGVEF